jgi:hypothetical protein
MVRLQRPTQDTHATGNEGLQKSILRSIMRESTPIEHAWVARMAKARGGEDGKGSGHPSPRQPISDLACTYAPFVATASTHAHSAQLLGGGGGGGGGLYRSGKSRLLGPFHLKLSAYCFGLLKSSLLGAARVTSYFQPAGSRPAVRE